MSIMQTMRETYQHHWGKAASAAAALWVLYSAAPAEAGDQAKPVKATVAVTDMVSDKRPYLRTEVMLKDLPVSAEGYVLWERQHDGGDFYKLRLQALPVSYGPLSAGAVVQHRDGKRPSDEGGLVGRIAGTVQGVSGKVDVRRFTEVNLWDSYGIASLGPVSVDFLFADNRDANSSSLRPGVDVKLGSGVSVGLEGGYSGKGVDMLHNDYTGVRVKKAF